mgnify:CR=1 FL=1
MVPAFGTEPMRNPTSRLARLAASERTPFPPADGEPDRKTSTWSAAEDGILLAAVATLGTNWAEVAANVHGRTADAARNRWHRLRGDEAGASPSPPGAVRQHPRLHWSEQEDRIIREGFARYGAKWRQISALLPGNRTDSAVRNRWARLQGSSSEVDGGVDGAALGGRPRQDEAAWGLRPPLKRGWSMESQSTVLDACERRSEDDEADGSPPPPAPPGARSEPAPRRSVCPAPPPVAVLDASRLVSQPPSSGAPCPLSPPSTSSLSSSLDGCATASILVQLGLQQ